MERSTRYAAGTLALLGGLHLAAGAGKPAQAKVVHTTVKKTVKTTIRRTTGPVTRLIIKDIKKGTGRQAKAGDTVTVHYIGTLTNGKKFDASRDHGQPFSFRLGAGMVIKGWDQGVAGMKVGGRRKLVIPASLGYGAQGSPPVIPPNATLIFVVDLLKVG